MDTYKGDSPAKKLVRAQFWARALETTGRHAQNELRIAFLIGRECGDVRTLRGFDIPYRSMVGVERDERAYEEALNKAPFVDIRFGDMEQQLCIPEFRRSFDIVLLDTCSPIDPSIIRKATRIAAYTVRSEGIMGIGYMMGREQHEEIKREMVDVREIAMKANARNRGLPVSDPYGKMVWITPEEFTPDNPDFLRYMRMYAIERLMFKEAVKFGMGVNARWSASYQSSTRTGRGVPMHYAAFRVWRPKRTGMQAAKGEFFKRLDTDPVPAPYVLENDPQRWEELVREEAIEFATRPGMNSAIAADVYNVNPNTVRAWLAHSTRMIRGD